MVFSNLRIFLGNAWFCSLLFFSLGHALSPKTSLTGRSSPPKIWNGADYASYWEDLLLTEYREAVDELRERRKTWTRRQLEDSGICVFGASAVPDSELLGEKIVRISKNDESRSWRDIFTRGEVLLLTPEMQQQRQFGSNKYAMSSSSSQPIPKECLIIDVGKDWMTVGVGATWPANLWESRKFHYEVRLDRAAPQAPLRAQRAALDRVRRNQGGVVAKLLADFYNPSKDAETLASEMPFQASSDDVEGNIRKAMAQAVTKIDFRPNESQKSAIEWALQRRVSLIRGPPGTGKTRVAALLIATALGLNMYSTDSEGNGQPPRVLAVTHSNGAADVLLEGLLQMGVPAVRLGRPASVSAHLQHRTVIAMSEKMPAIVELRAKSRDMELSSQERSAAAFELRQAMIDVQEMISETAPVVVTSCIGAHQLLVSELEKTEIDAGRKRSLSVNFPLVVLDEAAQTTEPALVCALAAARAEQLVLVGDTRQLPPTITCMNLLDSLGVSPMARIEECGVGEITLQTQYRMPPALLEHPSNYFYNGLVKCAPEYLLQQTSPPAGFRWPSSQPLAFVQVGTGDSEVTHAFGGRSNPTESSVVLQILSGLLATGDVDPDKIAIISPYAKQVQLIRSELGAMRNTQGVRVGTVDSFQGQETDVVIFSAVRSNILKEMGFLRDSRRLCVAITRARRGLIVVGDQSTLNVCRHWEALIGSMRDRGCIMSRDDLVATKPIVVDSLEDLLAENDVMKRLFGEEEDIFDLDSIDFD